MALSPDQIREQVVLTVEALVKGLSPNATEIEATKYIQESRAIVAGVLDTLDTMLDRHLSHTMH